LLASDKPKQGEAAMTRLFKLVALIAMSLSIFALPAAAQWQHNIKWSDSWHAPRARILFHNSEEVSPGLERRIHCLFPNVNLEGRLNFLAYLGLNFKSMSHLDVEPAIGYNLRQETMITSTRFSLYDGQSMAYSRAYAWLDLEYTPNGQGTYYFAQAEYSALEYVEFGLESEGWGGLDGQSKSIGLGPNLILHFRRGPHNINVDLAVHYRDLDDVPDAGWKPEFFFRLHLIPNLTD